jgi:cytochrome c oxidase assembly factor CtaG
MNPIARLAAALTAAWITARHRDRARGELGYTLETVLIVSGLAALAIGVVAGIAVAVHHYLSTIH